MLGASVGSPRCSRILRTTRPSVRNAISSRSPPQCGQVKTSIENARSMSSAQVERVRRLGWRALGEGADSGLGS